MSILLKAHAITHGERQENYGKPIDNMTQVVNIFNSIRPKKKLTPEDGAWFLIALKIAREQTVHKEDNLIDLAGYTWVLNEVIECSE